MVHDTFWTIICYFPCMPAFSLFQIHPYKFLWEKKRFLLKNLLQEIEDLVIIFSQVLNICILEIEPWKGGADSLTHKPEISSEESTSGRNKPFQRPNHFPSLQGEESRPHLWVSKLYRYEHPQIETCLGEKWTPVNQPCNCEIHF